MDLTPLISGYIRSSKILLDSGKFVNVYIFNVADLTIRLFIYFAIFFFYERAFSSINLIYTKYRNRLSIEKVNYLCFVYINRKILDRRKTEWKRIFKRHIDQLTIDEAVELEIAILEAQVQEDLETLKAPTR
jgi:hypothetical protein